MCESRDELPLGRFLRDRIGLKTGRLNAWPKTNSTQGSNFLEKRRRTTLCGNNTTLAEGVVEKLKVGLLEEGLGGTLGV